MLRAEARELEKMCLTADQKVLWHDRWLWGWHAALLMKKMLGYNDYTFRHYMEVCVESFLKTGITEVITFLFRMLCTPD